MNQPDEENRLAALHRLDLLDSEPEADFDAITDLAVGLTGARMAAVSLVDRERQWFKSSVGLAVDETPRSVAFCDHTIRKDELLEVIDAREDPRFADNPLVTGEPFIRGYAGVPIHDSTGYRIGTLCVIHDETLELDDPTRNRLKSLAVMIEQIIAQRERSKSVDLSNRQLAAIAQVQRHFISNARSLDTVYENLLEAALEATDSGIGFIGEILLDEDDEPYLVTHAISDAGWPPELRNYLRDEMGGQMVFKQKTSLIGQAVRSGELLIANAGDQDPRAGGAPPGHPAMACFAAVPIRSRGRFIGLLGLANRPGGYSAENFESAEPLIGTIANLVAEGRAEREREALLEQQRRVADRLQAVTELGGIGSWEINMATGHPEWDATTRAIHEVEDDFVPSMETAIEFYAPEARDLIAGKVEEGMKSGEPWDVELPLVTSKGNRRWVRAVGRAVIEDGEVKKVLGSFEDVTERRQREADIEALSNRLAMTLEASNIGAWEYCAKTNEHWWDDTTRALYRYPLGEPMPHPEEFRERLLEEDRDQVLKGMFRAFKTRERLSAEFRFRCFDGEVRYFRSHGLILEQEGRPPILTGFNYDITEDVMREREMEAARERAEAASQAKSQFLANMSHEIRTPLNGVLGMAQLLKMTDLDERQSGYLRTIHNSGRALLDLIEDILDISKIEAGMFELEEKPFSLNALVLSVVDVAKGLARTKPVEVGFELDEALPERLLGDQKRLRQILLNMAGNAVKFTESGFVRVVIRPSESGRVRFEVHDSGPGIPEAQRERIFSRFAQVDDSSSRAHGGTGLGLAICREIVELAGGEIGVDSEWGQGSTFWFELSLEPALDATGPAPGLELAAGGRAADGRALKILVVDDVSTNQLVAEALLRGAGHTVTLASNGQEAIERIANTPFDIVLMDIQMPVMTGDEAIRRIRASGEAYADIPIIAVTADATRGAEEQYLASGANDYLVKPLDMKAVLAVLGEYMRDAA